MQNISKRCAGWVTYFWSNEFRRSVLLLTFKYSFFLFVIQGLTGVVIFSAFSVATGDIIGNGPLEGLFTEDGASHEASELLIQVLFLVNLGIWFLGSIVSYFLAYVTLRPLKDTYDRQKQFVGDVAHELRTPLAVIKAGAETMLHTEHTLENWKSFTRDVLEEINRLTELSNDLLTLLKQKSREELTLEVVDYSKVVEKRITALATYASTQQISIISDIQPNILAYATEVGLSQIVINIAKNAVDHSHAGGRVIVSLTTEGNSAKLVIEDRGEGISDKDLPHIFERFYTASTVNASVEQVGTGLGLSIVADVVDTFVGSIEVESTLGEGSVFTILVPIS